MGEQYGNMRYIETQYPETKNVNKDFIADYLFKFLIIGSAGSGKSCLLHQFIENKCMYEDPLLPETLSYPSNHL